MSAATIDLTKLGACATAILAAPLPPDASAMSRTLLVDTLAANWGRPTCSPGS
jgi:hypothetical protein